MLPPETKPGFSISHSRESAWAWVSTRPVSSKTGSSAAAQTGSAVPVMSQIRSGTTRPAPRQAPCSSPQPTTTFVPGSRPTSRAAVLGRGRRPPRPPGPPARAARVEVGGGEHLRRPVLAPHVVEHGGRRVRVVDYRLAGEAVDEVASREEEGRGIPVGFRLLVAQPEYLGGHVGGVEV